MTPTDIAHVVLSLDPGGTERLVIDLARRCAQTYGTRVYCLDRRGEWADELDRARIPVHVVGRRPGLDLRVAWRLRQLTAQHGVRVLHCHQYTPFVYGALSSLPRRAVRVVFTEHGRLSDAPPTPRRRRANRFLAPLPAVITAVSAELRTFMVAEGFPAGRVQVVHNGIEPGEAPTAVQRRAARAEIGVDPGAFVIGTAARLDPVKHLGMAIDALAEVRHRVPTACLAVIGDGPERGRLEQAASVAGVADRVHWLGFRKDVRSLMAGLDVYVNTSISEGISVTILEAMAAAVPVVATAVGGTPEVVVPDATGRLIGTRDVQACARELAELAVEPERRAALGQAGRTRVLACFSGARMFERYLEAYRL